MAEENEECEPLTRGDAASACSAAAEAVTSSAHPPALRQALLVSRLPTWKRRCLRLPWCGCSNCLFIIACLLYLKAACEWLRLEDKGEAVAPGDWADYNRYTLAGAVVFVIEPALDFVGAWCAAVILTLEQAKWECGRARSSDSSASVTPVATQASWSTCHWVWTGYEVWDDERAMTRLMRSDLNFWAAVVFLVASLFYLYQAAVPFLYEDYCRCSDSRPECGSETTAESPAATISAQPVGYCIAGWLAALTFTFDAAIGLGAWYASRHRVQFLLGRERTVDWLAISAGLFMVGAVLEVIDCAVDDATLNFAAQFCWLMNGCAYMLDSYDTRKLSQQVLVPMVSPDPRSSHVSEIRWTPV